MTLPKTSHSAWITRNGNILTLLMTIILVGGAGYGYMQTQKHLIYNEKRTELATIADLKRAQIVQWRKERMIEATTIHTNAMMSHRINDFLRGEERDQALSELQAWMTTLHKTAGYSKVFLFKPDGELIASVTDDNQPPTDHYRQNVAKAVEKSAVLFTDFHDDNGDGLADIDLVIPLMYTAGNHLRCSAVLALDIDPSSYLYPMIQTWPTPSPTAETILVERNGNDVLVLNELRFMKQKALTFRRPLSQLEMPAVQAALGHEALFSGIDYRGIQVLSATRTIPGTPWAIVVKVDNAEIVAPLERRRIYVAVTCIILVFALNLGISLWWTKKKAAHLHSLYDAELRYNSELRKAEQALQEARGELEQRVTERTEQLTHANTKLQQEIAERTYCEIQLLNVKKLETIGQLAAGVAHEVRNPLNAILSITEALFREKDIEENPEFEPYIKHIRTQVTRLANLMNDLLDLGRTIPKSSLQAVPLHDLCCETITLWKSSGSAVNKNIVLVCDEDPSNLMILADSTKLQQVFFNLIENASHHNQPGSSVRFCIFGVDSPGTEHHMAVIRIIDEGKGIAPDKLNRIFDPFFSDRKGGTGLGLALVKHFIESMEGTVRIWNNEPPPGCTAEILIPLARKEHE